MFPRLLLYVLDVGDGCRKCDATLDGSLQLGCHAHTLESVRTFGLCPTLELLDVPQQSMLAGKVPDFLFGRHLNHLNISQAARISHPEDQYKVWSRPCPTYLFEHRYNKPAHPVTSSKHPPNVRNKLKATNSFDKVGRITPSMQTPFL